MSAAENAATLLQALCLSALAELARQSLENDPSNVPALSGLLAEAERAGATGEAVRALRTALSLVRTAP